MAMETEKTKNGEKLLKTSLLEVNVNTHKTAIIANNRSISGTSINKALTTPRRGRRTNIINIGNEALNLLFRSPK
jgi:hypothetical protein